MERTEETTTLTHNTTSVSLELHIEELRSKITARGDLSHVCVKEQILILDQLGGFPLGQFLIANRGLNGYWIDYIINESKQIEDREIFSEMEKLLLFEAPIMRATQERYQIFQREIRKQIAKGVSIASCPSGLMSDFLTLESSFPEGVHLYGVDIDQESLDEVQRKFMQLENPPKCTLIQSDAWHFTLPEQVNFIISNGLNIYVKDDQRVVNLYRQFYNVLKPGGTILTSVITPPTDWKMSLVDPQALRLQRILLDDILEIKWQNYRSVEMTQKQLEEVGFTNITFLYDAVCMYPTVLAHKLI